MPTWLARTIVAIVATSCVMAIATWASCSFYIGPKMWELYVRTKGELPKAEPRACAAPGEQAQAVLSGLLATLLALTNYNSSALSAPD